ncbi:MAG: hypothetical protein ABIL09_07935 [Gemmatimonadota bacterium]
MSGETEAKPATTEQQELPLEKPPAAEAAEQPAEGVEQPKPAPEGRHQKPAFEIGDEPEPQAEETETEPAGDADKPPAGTEEPAAKPAEKQDGKVPEAGKTVPGFDEEILSEAEALGLSREEAAEFGTPERLDRALRVLDRKFADLGRQFTPPEKPAAAPEKAVEKPQAEVPAEPDIAELKLDEDLDPSVSGPIKALQQEVLRLRKEAAEKRLAATEAETQRNNDMIDQHFAALGAEWKEVFGEGGIAELAAPYAQDASDQRLRADPRIKARDAVVSEMYALAAGYRNSRQKPPKPSELFKRALRLAHGDKYESLARNKVAGALKKGADQAIGRPAHRATAPLAGAALAVANAARFIKDRGGNATESDGL